MISARSQAPIVKSLHGYAHPHYHRRYKYSHSHDDVFLCNEPFAVILVFIRKSQLFNQNKVSAFDRVLWNHLGALLRSKLRAVFLNLSRGYLALYLSVRAEPSLKKVKAASRAGQLPQAKPEKLVEADLATQVMTEVKAKLILKLSLLMVRQFR